MDSNEIVTLDKNFASGNINDGFSTKKLSLNAIYFELDKWNIKQDAEIELAKIIAAMNNTPSCACRETVSY
jgi:hypothetical protein